MTPIDATSLRVELARLNVTRRRLAEQLSVPPSTLSAWLNGAAPAPQDLPELIEAALGLRRGSLVAASTAGNQP